MPVNSGARRARKVSMKCNKFSEGVRYFITIYTNTSSMHGLKYIVSSSLQPIERLIWLAAVISAVCGSATLSWSTWKRFQNNPTVVSMERNYKDWNTSFPSVTVCPEPKYDEMNIGKIIAQDFPDIRDKENVIEFIKELSNATYGKFGAVKTMADEIKSNAYWKVLWKVAFPFMYNVTNSNMGSYNETEMNQVITEVGLCYSYNSVSTIYNEPQIWNTNQWLYLRRLNTFKSSPLDGDSFTQISNMNSGYGLYILDPAEFPDVSIPKIEASNNSYKSLDLTALSIVSTKAVESLSIQQRKCRLPHESNLLTSPVYSYNLCRMECRMKESYRLCKCVPHFYRPIEDYPVCDLRGMQCLDKHSEQLIRMFNLDSGSKVSCDCLRLCNEVNYIIDTDNTMTWTLGTDLKWGISKYPKFRLKRDLLFGKTDLLVAIGGSAGLFLGCSLLSFAEVIYFFTLHLLLFVLRRNHVRK